MYFEWVLFVLISAMDADYVFIANSYNNEVECQAAVKVYEAYNTPAFCQEYRYDKHPM